MKLRPAFIVVVLLMLSGAVVWLCWQPRITQVRSIRLADGSIVRLKQVSFGKTHFAPETPVWQRDRW